MLLQFNEEGRFGHQLNQFIFLLALSLEYNCKFHYREFNKAYYTNLDNHSNLLNDYYVPKTLYTEVLYLAYLVLKKFKINKLFIFNSLFILNYIKEKELLNESDDIRKMLSTKRTVITDNILKEIPTLLKFRSIVCEQIKLSPEIIQSVSDKMYSLRNEYDVVVGVHIRRGDYKFYLNGKLYYSNEDYKRIMKRFVTISNVSEDKIVFVLCSDEKIIEEDFKEFNVFISNLTPAFDFALLQHSDYIMGPHSIFSLMANYLGNNKLYQIFDLKYDFTLDDFMESPEILSKRYMNISYVEEVFVS